jgi:hypothetical protein
MRRMKREKICFFGNPQLRKFLQRTFLLFQTRQKEGSLSTKKVQLKKICPAAGRENQSKKILIFDRNHHRLSGMESDIFTGMQPAGR